MSDGNGDATRLQGVDDGRLRTRADRPPPHERRQRARDDRRSEGEHVPAALGETLAAGVSDDGLGEPPPPARGRRSPAISMPAPETPVSRPAVCRWTWLRTCCSYGASTSPARPRRSVSRTTSCSACSMRSQPRATRSSRVALAAGGVTTKPFVSRLATAGDSFPSSLDVVAAVSRGGRVATPARSSSRPVSTSRMIDHHNDAPSGAVKKAVIAPPAHRTRGPSWHLRGRRTCPLRLRRRARDPGLVEGAA